MRNNMLIKSLQHAPIVKKGSYFYVVHPITDGVPEITPSLLAEVTEEMLIHIEKWKPFDKIVTMEAMGIPLATSISLSLKIPFTIIRKRSYGLPEEYHVTQETGYSKNELFINGLRKGDKVIIVDDVLSTGGTLKSVLDSLQSLGVLVKGVCIAVDKGENSIKLTKETKIPIVSLVHITVSEDTVNIINK
jgi:adenine phosphoribosyltransferase